MRQTGRLSSGFDARPSPTHNLTVFPVEAHLPLVLLLALQGFVHLLDQALVGLGPVQEAAGAGLLHHLRPHEAGQLTEAVRTVDDGVVVATLGISQQEVAVCEEREGRKQGSRAKKCFLGCQSCEIPEKHTVLFLFILLRPLSIYALLGHRLLYIETQLRLPSVQTRALPLPTSKHNALLRLFMLIC